MLVLTRRHGERIHIGDNIEVTVLRSAATMSDWAFSHRAPVAVHRDEVYQEILVAYQARGDGNRRRSSCLRCPVMPRPNRPKRPIPRPPTVPAL